MSDKKQILPRKIILVHPNYMGTMAFDFLAQKDCLEQAEKELAELRPYDIKCQIGEKFAKQNDLIMLGSEDLEHYINVNYNILLQIIDLIKAGWEMQFYSENN